MYADIQWTVWIWYFVDGLLPIHGPAKKR